MNNELKYVDDCWYCNAIIEALLRIQKEQQGDGLLSNMFLVTDIVKLVDGENENMPKKMSRKTAFKHIKELKEKDYLENGYNNLKLAYGRLMETANSTVPFLETLKFRDETINQIIDYIERTHFQPLSIGFRLLFPNVKVIRTLTS